MPESRRLRSDGREALRLLGAHADQISLRYQEPVGPVELAHGVLYLGPDRLALGCTHMGHELCYLRQDIPAVLHAFRERGESSYDRDGLHRRVEKTGLVESSLEDRSIAKRKHAGVLGRGEGGT